MDLDGEVVREDLGGTVDEAGNDQHILSEKNVFSMKIKIIF